jgi:hypothetical protein
MWSINTGFVGKGELTFPLTWYDIATWLSQELNMGTTSESKSGLKFMKITVRACQSEAHVTESKHDAGPFTYVSYTATKLGVSWFSLATAG